MKALVAGWFSFEDMGATVGDLLARDVACEWLREAGIAYDLAIEESLGVGVDWKSVDPDDYTHVLFVCGPFGNGWPATDFIERFRDRSLIGLDLSMNEPVDEWNPFDILIERDSPTTARPDLSLAAVTRPVPVIGVIKVHDQPLPGAMHEEVRMAIDELVASREVVVVDIDTQLHDGKTEHLRTPSRVESLIARMDAVVTMRMHGLVLALKHGVPALAVDPIAGGHKVSRQARALGWDIVLTGDEVSDVSLDAAFDRCLSQEARDRAAECADRGKQEIEAIKKRFLEEIAHTARR